MKRLICIMISVLVLSCSDKPSESLSANTPKETVAELDKAVVSSEQNAKDGGTTQYLEEVNYVVLKNPVEPSPGSISVTEFFWYGCPHCRGFEPSLQHWERTKPEGVVLQKVPAVWSKPMSLHARVYYVAKELDRVKDLHVRLFDEIIALRKERDPTKHVAPLAKVFEEFGMPTQEFERRLNSPEVSEQLKLASKLQVASEMHGTPALMVNGKYLVISKSVKGGAEVMKIVDFLIEKEKATAKAVL